MSGVFPSRIASHHTVRRRLTALHLHLAPSSTTTTTSTRPPLNLRTMSSSAGSGASPSGPTKQSTLSFPPPKFPKSDVSKYSQPLGPGKHVNTAACLIIGDEVLNGKTKDSNSHYLAQFCFNRGIELKRIEVIADDEEEIGEAVRRMADRYDFVVTSGGIGPTFDDITYESIGKAFGAVPLQYDSEVLRRMEEINKTRTYSQKQTEEMITARKRMALFPNSVDGRTTVDVIFPTEELWVPVVRVAGKVHILPGVPRLFEALLDGLEPYIPIDKSKPRPNRVLVHTKMPESSIAPYLDKLVAETKPLGIKIGSYPKWNAGVDVSLIGDDLDTLLRFGKQVEVELKAKIVKTGKIGDDDGEGGSS